MRALLATLMLVPAALALVPNCGTDAVGVDECRDIEVARCDAAQHCYLAEDFDAEQCRRFYRDQCLHGLATIEGSPGAPVVRSCVRAIERAGQCAKEEGADSNCSGSVSVSSFLSACELVKNPEYAEECSFLAEEPFVPEAGTGGAGGGQGGVSAAGSGGVVSVGGSASAGAAGAAGS